MVDALLLEFEGVLCDTSAARAAAWHAAWRAAGGEGPPGARAGARFAAAAGLPVGMAAAVAMREARPDDPTAIDLATWAAERTFADAARRGLPLMPGAAPFVEQAAAACPLALVTRLPRGVLDTLLSLGGLPDLFGVVVTADDGVGAKPSPAMHLRALDRLGRRGRLAPARCLAVEDAPEGAAAAHAAGVPCIVLGAAPPAVPGIVRHVPSLDALAPFLAGVPDAMIASER